MEKLKYYFMTMLVMLVSAAMVSCGDDDDDNDYDSDDYYIEVSASGGGLSSSEIAMFENEVNSQLREIEMDDVNRKTAEKVFNYFVEELKSEYANGWSFVTEPFYLTLKLKLGSKTIKTATLTITQTGVS